MAEVLFTYSDSGEQRTIKLDADKITFGRGSEAEVRINDESLSRLHAAIYRDGERVWIVDQGSTNGTYVNDIPAASSGTPLKNGDRIRIGNNTVLSVEVLEPSAKASGIVNASPQVVAPSISDKPASILPVVVIAAAIFVISVSAVIIGYGVISRGSGISENRELSGLDDETNTRSTRTPQPANTEPKTEPSIPTATDDLPVNSNAAKQTDPPAGKKYLEMSDSEKRQYIEAKAMRIAQIIGNSSSDTIPQAAIDKIKGFVDGYASRLKAKTKSGCSFGDNLQATYERASKNAPFIVRAFNEKGIDPRIGLYLAMIESEHCVCLQSPTGPLGMFQFTKATAQLHGLKVISGASTSNPDERCQPEPAARAAASYMKALTGRYGTGPSSVPLAIGSYNSGEGGLSSNLEKALSTDSGLPRDFWTLIAKGDVLSKQFQAENFKYVPKFFAAAIIGENPTDFGLNLQPISTYTR